MIIIAVIIHTLFLVVIGVFSEYLKYIQIDEFYRIIIVLLFFFLDFAFCAPIINKTFKCDLKKGAKILKCTYIVLWILILSTFPLIVIIPLELFLSLWTLLFTLYILVKIFVYRKNYKRPFEKIITMLSKIDFAITLIFLVLIMGFQFFKGIYPFYEYTETTIAYFVGYEEVQINNVYVKNYPKFLYEVNGTQYISKTKNPVFLKIYDVKKEKEIKILYKEKYPNDYIFIKNQAIWNIVGGIFSFLLIICFIIFYRKYKIMENSRREKKT